MGILEVLTVIFVVLKMTGNIDWSWFWVFSPLILVYGTVILLFVLYFMINVVLDGVSKIRR